MIHHNHPFCAILGDEVLAVADSPDGILDAVEALLPHLPAPHPTMGRWYIPFVVHAPTDRATITCVRCSRGFWRAFVSGEPFRWRWDEVRGYIALA